MTYQKADKKKAVAMKPGRELDALVAEKVMGVAFKDTTIGEEPWATKGLFLTRNGEPYQIHGYLMHGYVYPEVREYSTDIAAAWGVVEKMQADGWFWNIDCDCDGLVVGFGRGCEVGGGCEWYYEDAETAPHAICLAALKAME